MNLIVSALKKDDLYNKKIIETACDECGVTADYYTDHNDDACNCGFEHGESIFPENPMLAQSYVPIQFFR